MKKSLALAPPIARTFPVIEIFGPTVQGEGLLAGIPTHFVRFGGCDYHCSWCDSLYAVEPELVRANAEKMYGDEVVARVAALPRGPLWVTLSGGNPALLELDGVVRGFHGAGFFVAVETQGSRWRDWLGRVDCLTVSPKPPSSGMVSAEHDAAFEAFMREAVASRPHRAADAIERDVLKIVVFDDADFEWAVPILWHYGVAGGHGFQTFLSCGTDPPAEDESREETLALIADRYRWLCEKVAVEPRLAYTAVLPQLHVLAWSHARGV